MFDMTLHIVKIGCCLVVGCHVIMCRTFLDECKVGHFGYNVPISVHAIGRGGHKCCVISNFILHIPFIVFFNIHGYVQLLRSFHEFFFKKN